MDQFVVIVVDVMVSKSSDDKEGTLFIDFISL